uniref:BTB domain-containing protein n=1 Tax=Caenorhabditis tropicalis TaxID=1561998 RepID=A0A1I7TCK5_9PELO
MMEELVSALIELEVSGHSCSLEIAINQKDGTTIQTKTYPSTHVKQIETSEINDAPLIEGLVKLNVGGTVFQTTKTTLNKFDGFFRGLLRSDRSVAKDENGNIFIDRDPKHFRLILNFMRYDNVDIPYSDRHEIRKEAEYYSLRDLVKLCDDAKPVQMNDRFFKSISEVTTAVANSTKEGVIVVWYQEDECFFTLSQNIEIIMNYGDEYDVFYISYDKNRSMMNYTCNVFNKATKKKKECTFTDLQRTIESLFGATEPHADE